MWWRNTGDSPDVSDRVRAALLWVEAGEPDLPVEMADMKAVDLQMLIESARSCPPDRRDFLLGRTGG